MNNTTNNTILVIGSTGKTGKRVADQLEVRGIAVRHGSRSADIPFDWHSPQTWAAALEGVDKVYLTYYPDLDVQGSVEAVSKLTDLAKDAGVRRLVLLSGRNEAERRHGVRAGVDDRAARILRAELQRGAWLEEVLAGTVSLPIDDVQEPFVDADDIADVAAAPLTHDRDGGQLYQLTRPRLVHLREPVAAIGKASGRDIGLVSVSIQE